MTFDFKNKTVLVTGSSRGIGYSIGKLFAKSGAQVAIHYNKDKVSAEKLFNELEGNGHIIVQADLADTQAAELLVEKTIKYFGRIDILVNNAGIYEEHPIDEVSLDEWKDAWQKTIDINLHSPAVISFCAAKYMEQNGGGRIINITSRGAFRGEPRTAAYGASKAGLNSMSQSMAVALAPKNIFVYAIAPGYVETDMTTEILDRPDGDFFRNQSPLNRVAKPEELAHTVAFLASEGSEFLTGGIVDVNGASYLRS